MNCDDIYDHLVAYLLAELDPGTEERIDSHLQKGCLICDRRLDEISESIELLSRTSTSQTSPDVWKRIQKLVGEDRAASLPSAGIIPTEFPRQAPEIRQRPAIVRSTFLAFAATACGFLLAAVGFELSMSIRPDLQKSSDSILGIDAPYAVRSQLNGTSGELGESKQSLRSVSVKRPADESKIYGTFIVDALENQIHFCTNGWQRLSEGRRYAVWFVTQEDEHLFASFIDGSTSPKTLTLIEIPSARSPIIALAVTIESADFGGNDIVGIDSVLNPSPPQFVSDSALDIFGG